MQRHQFSDTTQLNQQFVQALVAILTEAIARQGRASLVVCGGNTPKALYQLLAQQPLDWANVTVLLTDERLVKPDDHDSNELMIRTHLLQHYAHAAQFISFYQPKIQSFVSIDDLDNQLRAFPMFDAVILGMGNDGHTASLFPCCDEIVNALSDDAQAVMVTRPKTVAHQRITLTKTRLLHSHHLFLYLIGTQKIAVLNQALATTNPLAMPISVFLHHPTCDIHVMFTAKAMI